MRLVIEITDAERADLRALTTRLGPKSSYSGLIRALLRACSDGKIDLNTLTSVSISRPATECTPITEVPAPTKKRAGWVDRLRNPEEK